MAILRKLSDSYSFVQIAKMDKNERMLKLYYGQTLALIKALEGRSLAGRLFKNSRKIKDGWLRAAEDILLKMIEIDENSPYLKDIRQKLSLYKNSNSKK